MMEEIKCLQLQVLFKSGQRETFHVIASSKKPLGGEIVRYKTTLNQELIIDLDDIDYSLTENATVLKKDPYGEPQPDDKL